MKFRRFTPFLTLFLSSLAALSVTPAVEGADVSIYTVKKGIQYAQTDSGPPVAGTNNSYVFEADVFSFLPNEVTSAMVLLPPPIGTNQALAEQPSQNQFQLRHKYNTQTALNTHYPDGNYALGINAIHDGTKTLNLALTGAAYPNAPHLTDFPTLQMVNANGYFQATWGPFAGGTSNDFVQFRIEDLAGNKLFETPDYGKPGALNGTALSTLVYAPGILTAGQTNNGTLTFQTNVVVDSNSYPGAVGVADYYIRTSFSVITTTSAAPDVKLYEVTKGRRFVQNDTNAPTPNKGQEFDFQASVQASSSNLVASASALFPGNKLQSLPSQGDGVNFAFSDASTTQIALDAFYANGAYTFTIHTVDDGTRSLTLPLTGNAYPPPPHIANFDATQSVYANEESTVAWDPWPGGNSADFIQLRIEDLQNNKIFATPDLGKVNALDGTATSAVVKAGSLVPGQSYNATLLFKRIPALDTTNYPAALGLADYYGRTTFTINTAPADAKSYSVLKGQQFIQSGSSAPIPSPTAPFVFETTVSTATSNVVSNAEVSTPLPAVDVLTLQLDGNYDFTGGASSKSALDGTYPAGTYVVGFTTAHDGLQNLSVALPGDAYPVVPHVNNAYNAQLISFDADFLLSWDAFSSGTSNDFVRVEITDLAGNFVFKSKGITKSGALTGLSNSVVIPAYTLAPGAGYKATLQFENVLSRDSISYPGSLGVAGYFTRTYFGMATRSLGAGNPPSLASWQVSSGGQFQFLINGIAGETYRIDGSSNLVQWIPLATNTAGIIFTDPNSTKYPHFFYRAVFLP